MMQMVRADLRHHRAECKPHAVMPSVKKFIAAVGPATRRSSFLHKLGFADRHCSGPGGMNISSSKGVCVMNTVLVTSQILCYGVGIVSASLNIAIYLRRHRVRLRRVRNLRTALQAFA
jgi:hypothetical protein